MGDLDDFRPVPDPKRHDWRATGDGAAAMCTRCGMGLVSRVDVALAPRAVLVVAGPGERYDPAKHGRCGAAR